MPSSSTTHLAASLLHRLLPSASSLLFHSRWTTMRSQAQRIEALLHMRYTLALLCRVRVKLKMRSYSSQDHRVGKKCRGRGLRLLYLWCSYATCHYSISPSNAMLKPNVLRHYLLLSTFTLVLGAKTMTALDDPAQSHMRSLSAEDPRTDRFEERNFDELFGKIAWKVENVVPSLRLKLALDKEKAINKLFERSHVNSEGTHLFASVQYQKWARPVISVYGDSAKAYKALYTGLKKHFTDYELATFILDGLASQKTKAVAQQYYDLQMQDWVANKKALEVFSALQLGIDKGNVFKNPLLETYVSFARRLPREKLDEQPIFDELLRMLTHKIDIDRLTRMLGATDVDLSEGSVGHGMMRALMWNPNTRKPIDPHWYVKYVSSNYAIVDPSAVTLSLSYAKWSLKRAEYEKLVTDMVNDLWNERKFKVKTLATVIVVAQKDVSTRKVATNALKKLCLEWKEEGKSSNDVLNMLGLKLAEIKAEDMVEFPLLETWFAFESRMHAKDAEFLAALQRRLTEEQLASLLVMEAKDPNLTTRLDRVRKALRRKGQGEFLHEDGTHL